MVEELFQKLSSFALPCSFLPPPAYCPTFAITFQSNREASSQEIFHFGDRWVELFPLFLSSCFPCPYQIKRLPYLKKKTPSLFSDNKLHSLTLKLIHLIPLLDPNL